MEVGFYHFIYVVHGTSVDFGATMNIGYKGNDIRDDPYSCCVGMWGDGSFLYGKNGEKVQEPSRYLVKDEKYEIIYNMYRRTLSIKYEDGFEEVCFKNFKSPLYPFAIPYRLNESIELINFWKI